MFFQKHLSAGIRLCIRGGRRETAVGRLGFLKLLPWKWKEKGRSIHSDFSVEWVTAELLHRDPARFSHRNGQIPLEFSSAKPEFGQVISQAHLQGPLACLALAGAWAEGLKPGSGAGLRGTEQLSVYAHEDKEFRAGMLAAGPGMLCTVYPFLHSLKCFLTLSAPSRSRAGCRACAGSVQLGRHFCLPLSALASSTSV